MMPAVSTPPPLGLRWENVPVATGTSQTVSCLLIGSYSIVTGSYVPIIRLLNGVAMCVCTARTCVCVHVCVHVYVLCVYVCMCVVCVCVCVLRVCVFTTQKTITCYATARYA